MALTIEQYLQQAPASSKQIQAATGLNQAAVSRQLRELRNHVISFKKGRSPIYALTKNAFGADDKLSLFMVDAYGNNSAIAIIRPLASGGFYLEPRTGLPSVLLGHRGDGHFDDLPFFLSDLRPQGFLGRQIASELSSQTDDFPSDPRRWNSDHVGRYLISNGDDLPGNFQLGPQAHFRLRRKPLLNSVAEYPMLADNVTRGAVPGSSAGGEQPKFTAYCTERSAHVIVKFSPKGRDTVASRWRDILITEHLATKVLHDTGAYPAAETHLIEKEERLFLESQRFDRSGEFGRLSMISLQAIDAEFTGVGDHWLRVVSALHSQGRISRQHVVDVAFLWGFGRLINNTDMHLGNLSAAVNGDIFNILPAYDMCSMGFAPKSGEVLPFEFEAPDLREIDLLVDSPIVDDIEIAAYKFWSKLTSHADISNDFKAYLKLGNPIDRISDSNAGQTSLF